MTRFLYIVSALLLMQCWPARAADQNCMNGYYRTRSPDCLDMVLSQLRQAPRSKSDPATIIGFLAQIFINRPRKDSASSTMSHPNMSGDRAGGALPSRLA